MLSIKRLAILAALCLPTLVIAQAGAPLPVPPVIICSTFLGADAGAQMANCIAAGPSTLAIYDASGLVSNQTGTATITISKPAKLILPNSYTSSAAPVFSTSGVVDIGCSTRSSPTVSNCTVVSTSATGDFFDATGGALSLHDVNMISQTGSTRTAGSGVHVRSGVGVKLSQLRFEETWIGINMAEGGTVFDAENIGFTSANAINGAWYAFWVMGGCTGAGTPTALGCSQAATAKVTDSEARYIVGGLSKVLSGSSPGAFILDALTDSVRIYDLEAVASGTCLTTDCGALFKVQNSIGAAQLQPIAIRCDKCSFEGATSSATSPLVSITAGIDIRFNGGTVNYGGRECFLISPATTTNGYVAGVQITDTTINYCGREGIKIVNPGASASAANGLSVSNVIINENIIYGTSQDANNTYSSILVAANAARFTITNNRFDELGGNTPHPKYYVEIAAGTSDYYHLTNNYFSPTARVTGDYLDGGSGANKTIGPNTGTTQSMQIPGSFTMPTLAGGGTQFVAVDNNGLFGTSTGVASAQIPLVMTGSGIAFGTMASYGANVIYGGNAGGTDVDQKTCGTGLTCGSASIDTSANVPSLSPTLRNQPTGDGSAWTGVNVDPGPNYCVDAVGSDAYACNLTPAITAYTTGARYSFLAATANTGTATLALNGIASPKTIQKWQLGALVALETGDIIANQQITVQYNGTVMVLQSDKSILATDVPPAVRLDKIYVVFDGGGSTIATSTVSYKRVAAACTIVGWSIIAVGSSPTTTIDIWRVASGTALPAVGNTIMGTKPALSSGNAVKSTTLTGWSPTALSADDILGFNVDAVANATWMEFALYCQR